MPGPSRELLSALKPLRALVVGDLILDHYAWGRVERISPEAPIQILAVDRDDVRLGGAGNVAANLAALGARTVLVGLVGLDPQGKDLARMSRTMGVTPRLVGDPAGRTTMKTRLLAHDQQILRVDRERPGPASPAASRRLQAAAMGALRRADLLVVSDYAKGCLDEGLAAGLLKEARRRGIPAVAGPKRGLSRYRGALALSLNLSEAGEAVGESLRDDDAVQRAGKSLRRRLGLKVLLVTRGKEGLSCFWDDGSIHIPARARSVYDVTGAGDTVLAAFALALAGGAHPAQAARIANAAGAIVVGKLGAATVSRAELDVELGEGPSNAKVRQLPALQALLAPERRAGKRIVFTNGCFDLLHAGHVKLLEEARASGDRLVVGLNSDRSVRALKGPGRPLQSQEERAALLAGLASVDDVVIYDELTPRRVIEAIRPDILVKGSDYAGGTVVGRDRVERDGGRVKLVPLLEGASSSDLIRRIRRIPEGARRPRRGHSAPARTA